jgi:DNA-directed RNA polymerase subunit RPC12/RpoP
MFGRLRQRRPEAQLVECPSCGQQQELDKGVLSAFCKRCHRRLSVDELTSAGASNAVPVFDGSDVPMVNVTCTRCGRETPVPKAAINAKCRHCRELIALRKGRPVARAKRGGRVEGPRAQVFRCYTCGAELTAAEEALSTMCPKCGRRVELRDLEVTAHRQQDMFTCGRVHVAAGGLLEGSINASVVLIEGEVRGPVTSGSSLVVGATGRCYGQVVARALRVEHGAVLVGPVRLNEELLQKT